MKKKKKKITAQENQQTTKNQHFQYQKYVQNT